jgi:hypothetical protein
MFIEPHASYLFNFYLTSVQLLIQSLNIALKYVTPSRLSTMFEMLLGKSIILTSLHRIFQKGADIDTPSFTTSTPPIYYTYPTFSLHVPHVFTTRPFFHKQLVSCEI